MNTSPVADVTGLSSSALADSVHSVLREMIEHENPTLAKVAARLAIRVRTLQRLLAAHGTTFKQMLEEHRQMVAIAYLAEGGSTITDVAFRLGYSDSAHFTRAFRRWTGCCPRDLQTNREIGARHPALAPNGKLAHPVIPMMPVDAFEHAHLENNDDRSLSTSA